MKRARAVAIPPVTLNRRRALAPQIASAIRAAIRNGRLQPGDRVPSTRVLAAALRVARQIVVSAYEDLVASGDLQSRTGDGSRVAQTLMIAAPTTPTRVLRDPDGFEVAIFRIG